VNNSNPVVFVSSRPITIQRPARGGGRRSKTVGRPCGSRRVVTSPAGLLYRSISRLVGATTASRWPSRQITAAGSTRSPSAATRPSTVSRPARIQPSISRLEPWPAAASTFCSRSAMR
jgi:hypothetical protein